VSSPAAALASGLAAGLAVAVWVAFVLMRRLGGALRRVDDLEAALDEAGLDIPEPELAPKLPIGSPAPSFPGAAELLSRKRATLLVFTSAGCGPCRELKPKLAAWRGDFGGVLEVTELSYEDEGRIAEAFGVEGTPAAVAIGPYGTVESAVAHGSDAIEALFEEALLEALPVAEVGEALAELTLETLDGERAGLRSSLAPDRDTLVLFWNPIAGSAAACETTSASSRTTRGAPGRRS
jgi:thioredoxin 1